MKVVCRSDKKRNMSERSELVSLPERRTAFMRTRRAASAVAFFGLPFFGEAKKVTSRRLPRQVSVNKLRSNLTNDGQITNICGRTTYWNIT